MKLIIDTDDHKLIKATEGEQAIYELYSNEAFELISQQWLKVGWNQKYTYTFTWLGRPIIQLPEDLIRLQEVIYRVSPDVIVETGIAHGGSLVYYASICKAMGKGRVIGIDVEIRPANLEAIRSHDLSSFIELVIGNSVDNVIIKDVKSRVKTGETVLLLLDSAHDKKHVKRELEAYHDLVAPGSYIVVMDGIMADLADVPKGHPNWRWDNPAAAVQEFIEDHPEFAIEKPGWRFNESSLSENVTHWPNAWLKRLG